MSNVEDKELDALVDALLDEERKRVGPNADVMAELWSGIERRLPHGPIDGADGGTSDAPPEAGPRATSNPPPDPTTTPATDASKASGSLASGGGPAVRAASVKGITAVGWKMAGIAIVSALAGGVGGAWIHARTATPVEIVVERTVAPSYPSVAASVTVEPVAPSASVSASSTDADVAVPKKAPAPSPVRPPRDDARTSADDALARERSLLDMGRTALARGDTDAALAAVRSLEREAKNGQLVEERELLAVQSLVTANRMAEARQRAARFREKYPSSPLLDVVDDAVSP